ncbi:MAG TPA: hypothetical protein PLG20_09910 [Candidatus Syntrophosphaera sp.]|nr:hypothetical protein [Candidatus Syntrophosphaera sp.]
MGTQQLLLIVLGVIIVGVAIAVGITIFNNQAYNSNQQAVASELNNYAAMAIQWWKTPIAQGGGGQVLTDITAAKIATWVGLTETDWTTTTTNITDSGYFWVDGATTAGIVTIIGVGDEVRNSNKPKVTTTIDLTDSSVESAVSTQSTATTPG